MLNFLFLSHLAYPSMLYRVIYLFSCFTRLASCSPTSFIPCWSCANSVLCPLLSPCMACPLFNPLLCHPRCSCICFLLCNVILIVLFSSCVMPSCYSIRSLFCHVIHYTPVSVPTSCHPWCSYILPHFFSTLFLSSLQLPHPHFLWGKKDRGKVFEEKIDVQEDIVSCEPATRITTRTGKVPFWNVQSPM